MASRRSLKKQSIILQNWQQDSVWWNQQTQMQKNGKLTAKYSCRLSTCVMTSSAASATQEPGQRETVLQKTESGLQC